MKYCPVDGLRYSDKKSHCRNCKRVLIPSSALDDSFDFATSCCPNPHCPELVAPPHTKYCGECGAKLSPISFDAWLKKFVEPAFEQNPIDVLLPASKISAPLAQMGLPKDEGMIYLDQFLADNAGIGRPQFNQWMQNVAAILKDQETELESRKYQARKEAANFKISPFVASMVVDRFTSGFTEESPAAETKPATAAVPLRVGDEHGELSRRANEIQSDPSVGEKSSFNQANVGTSNNGNRVASEIESKIPDDPASIPSTSDPLSETHVEPNVGSESAKPRGTTKRITQKTVDWQTILVIVGLLVLISGVPVYFVLMRTAPPTAKRESTEPNNTPNPNSPPVGMVRLEGGDLEIGSDEGDLEKVQRVVPVTPFDIDTKEVTCKEYEEFLKKTNHPMPPQWKDKQCPPEADDLPVTGVDWYDAQAYAESVEKRLPTYEEWEFAARGKKLQRYPWGNKWIPEAANADSSSDQRSKPCQSKAGTTKSGICDLIGNVWEWTASKRNSAPTGKRSRTETADLRIIKGGAYDTPSNQATATYRGFWYARREDAIKAGNDRFDKLGFRCAKSINK